MQCGRTIDAASPLTSRRRLSLRTGPGVPPSATELPGDGGRRLDDQPDQHTFVDVDSHRRATKRKAVVDFVVRVFDRCGDGRYPR